MPMEVSNVGEPLRPVVRVALRETATGRVLLRHAVDAIEIVQRNPEGAFTIDEHQNHGVAPVGRQELAQSAALASSVCVQLGDIDLAQKIHMIAAEDRLRLKISTALQEAEFQLPAEQRTEAELKRLQAIIAEAGLDQPKPESASPEPKASPEVAPEPKAEGTEPEPNADPDPDPEEPKAA